ncbi:MAG TPA: hypothetical protein VFH99_00550 [Candidatus Saccharimonadales bacterium]|nr:hypothetical protein [Candidatus Saccharimonadales bacterium]
MNNPDIRVGAVGEDITTSIEVIRHYARGIIYKVVEMNEVHAIHVPEKDNPQGDDWIKIDDPQVNARDGRYAEVSPAESLVRVVGTDANGLAFEVGETDEDWQPGATGRTQWRVYYSDSWQGILTGFATCQDTESEPVASTN